MIEKISGYILTHKMALIPLMVVTFVVTCVITHNIMM